jgi:hypothetical protein
LLKAEKFVRLFVSQSRVYLTTVSFVAIIKIPSTASVTMIKTKTAEATTVSVVVNFVTCYRQKQLKQR